MQQHIDQVNQELGQVFGDHADDLPWMWDVEVDLVDDDATVVMDHEEREELRLLCDFLRHPIRYLTAIVVRGRRVIRINRAGSIVEAA